jgi:hypothetical protein
MKVHKVTLLVVDFDNLGADAIEEELENTRFANDCMSPHVMDVQTTEVEWSDDHPLNIYDTMEEEFHRLFGGTRSATIGKQDER